MVMGDCFLSPSKINWIEDVNVHWGLCYMLCMCNVKSLIMIPRCFHMNHSCTNYYGNTYIIA